MGIGQAPRVAAQGGQAPGAESRDIRTPGRKGVPACDQGTTRLGPRGCEQPKVRGKQIPSLSRYPLMYFPFA